jgi:hypothetical protein
VEDKVSWCVFDRPLMHDWLFLVGLVLGTVAVVQLIRDSDKFGAVALVLAVVTGIPAGVLLAGILGGTVREYVRGRSG